MCMLFPCSSVFVCLILRPNWRPKEDRGEFVLLMLKILQARLQQYMNHELPDVHTGFRKGRGTRIANLHWITKKNKRVPEKHLFVFYWLCQSLWLCRSQQTVENSSRDGNTRAPYLTPQKLVCRLRSNWTGHGTTDWFQTGKGVRQGCISSPCLFNLYAEYMRNAGLDEAQLESRLLGEISITLAMQIIPPLWQKVKRNWRASWWKWKRRVKKLA